MKELTLPTTLTLPTKLPRVRSLTTVEAVPALPRLPSYNKEAVANAQYQKQLQEEQAAQQAAALANKKDYKGYVGLMDPNDPYSLNSVADWFLNRKAKEKRYGGFAKFLHKIPVLGDAVTGLVAGFDVGFGQQWASIFKGDFKAFGINMLTNFSETMDIIANPVKSLIAPLVNKNTDDPKYKLPWYKRLRASVGFGKEGRYNYDYDTGFWLSDFGLEIISDPMNLISLGAWGIGKAAATKGIKSTAKESAAILAKEAVTEASEKALKETGEALTEEAIQKLTKTTQKRIVSKMIKDSVELRRLGVETSKSLKSFAKKQGDKVLREAIGNLDTALASSKGIIDDTVKSIMESITKAVKAYGDRVPPELLKNLDKFTTVSKYSLADFTRNSFGGVLNKAGEREHNRLLKLLSEASARGDSAQITELNELIRDVLIDPKYIKKYKNGLKINADTVSLFKEIELTDYLDALNTLRQDVVHYKFLNALDRIGEATNFADKLVFRAAMMGSPATRAIWFGAKTHLLKKVGNFTAKWFIRRLQDVTDFFNSKTVAQALFEIDNEILSAQAVVRRFNIFSGEDIFSLDFGKEYAQNIYNRTLDWARGFGRPEQYAYTKVLNKSTGLTEEVQKPVNILILSSEERKKHLIANFGEEYLKSIGATEDTVEELFFRRLNEVGHYGFTGNKLETWDLAKYVASIQPDEATLRLQQLYSDFTATFAKTDSVLNSPQAFIKFVSDLDTHTAKSTIKTVYNSAADYIAKIKQTQLPFAPSPAVSLAERLREDFNKAGYKLSEKTSTEAAENLLQVSQLTQTLQTQYDVLEQLQKAGEDYLVVKGQLETVKNLQFQLRSRVSQLKVNFKDVPENILKATDFQNFYKNTRRILSPFFGQEQVFVENAKVFYEIRGNARFITHKILESEEFQELVTAFRTGNDGYKLLETNKAEAQAILNQSGYSKAAKNTARTTIDDIQRITDFFKSVDNYVELVALVKQSKMPPMMQEVFFDTLQNFEIKDATSFLREFKANTAKFVQQMDIGLAGKYGTHRFTLDYYATKLLNDPEYSKIAQKYLSSGHTALDDAEFSSILFKTQILPEVSKTKKVIINGKEVDEFVNEWWHINRNNSFVYLDFEVTGLNPSLNQIYDIGVHAPDFKESWQYTHKAFDIDTASESVKNRLTQGTLNVSADHNEVNALLELYSKLKSLVDTNPDKRLHFIFQNSQNLNIDFIDQRFIEAITAAQASQDYTLLEKLVAAKTWLVDNLKSNSMSNISLLKQIEGIPSVGQHYNDVVRFLQASAESQSRVNSTMMLYLNEDIFNSLEKFPPLSIEAYRDIKNALVDILHQCNNAKYLWNVRAGTMALDGTFLVDGDIYSPLKEIVFDDETSITKVLQSNEVYIPDKSELIEFKNNRWYFNQQALPEDILDANAAVKYLKSQGIEYAPSWRALNLQQQLSTYPVLINGEVSMQTIEGIAPVAFRRYVDTNLIKDFFDITKAPYQAQHALTSLAQKMSAVISKIKNTEIIDNYAKRIEELYDYLIAALKKSDKESVYSLLKRDLSLYHKYAALVVLAKDETVESGIKQVFKWDSYKINLKAKPQWDEAAIGLKEYPPRPDFKKVPLPKKEDYYNLDKPWDKRKYKPDYYRLLEQAKSTNEHLAELYKQYKQDYAKVKQYNRTVTELYRRKYDAAVQAVAEYNKQAFESYKEARKLIIYPQDQVYQKTHLAQIFEDYDAVTRVDYYNSSYSRSNFLEKIYDSEQKGMTYHARALQDALKQDSDNILSTTDALKLQMDKNKIYAPVMQRHAVLGQAHITLNDTYISVVNNLRDGLELDTFLACDKQIVNNLEDLILLKVCKMSPQDLQSFVYHQGKGVIIIPLSGYLTDTTVHSFDIKDSLSAFAIRYQDYEDEFIKVIKKDGDLIIHAKDYITNMKRELIPYKPLSDIDYDAAFRGAFGYPKDWESAEYSGFTRQELGYLKGEEVIPFLESQVKSRKTLINSGVSAKQAEFLMTHIEQIEKLRIAHLKHHQELTRLASDYDDQYSYMLGGYGRTMDSSQASEVFEALPEEVRLAVFNNELPEKAYYNTSEHMFNFSTLGRAAYRKKYEHFATSSYQSLMAQTYRSLNNNLSSVAQYASFYYNAQEAAEYAIPKMMQADMLIQDPSVASKPVSCWSLDSIFGDTSDEAIFNMLHNKDEFTLSYLGIDKKGLPRVEVMNVTSVKDITFARSKGAILLPSTTTGSIIQTMNNHRWANSKLKVFHKVNYFLKACMLIHPGFLFRNFIDSTLKNFLISKNPSSMMQSYSDALSYYTKYKETVNMLFAINPDSPFRPDTLKIIFEDSTAPLSEELFMLVHNFLESGPSAGSINKVQQFYLKKAAEPSLVNQVYDTLLMPTKGIEQITRLAAYLEFIKKGMTNTDAFQAITKAHFDYASKAGVTRLLELVIPFYSFQAKNFEFWLDFMNKNPVLTQVLSKYFQSVWNWDEIDFDRIEYYQSKLNHIMQANIQLNDAGLTLKVNPSFMDPINIMSNPIDSFASRVSPIFKPIVDAIQQNDPYGYEQLAGTAAGAALSAIPGPMGLVGSASAIASQTASRYKSGYRSYQRTGSVLPLIAPSIFGSVRTPAQYGRASYTNSRAFRDPQKRQPRRVNIYNKLYTDTGKNRWQLRYLPVDNFTIQWRIRESTNRFR